MGTPAGLQLARDAYLSFPASESSFAFFKWSTTHGFRFGLLRSAKRNGPSSTSPTLFAVRLMMRFVLSWVTGPGPDEGGRKPVPGNQGKSIDEKLGPEFQRRSPSRRTRRADQIKDRPRASETCFFPFRPRTADVYESSGVHAVPSQSPSRPADWDRRARPRDRRTTMMDSATRHTLTYVASQYQ